MSSKQNIVSESLITPALAAKMRVFFEGVEPSSEVKYKHLYSSLQQDNQNKAQRLLSLTSKLQSISRPQSMNTSRNKFSKLSQPPSFIEHSSKNSMFNSFEESYLSEKMIAEGLQKQHLEYENSLLRLKRSIKDMNNEINQIKVKQPLYDKLETISRFQKISSLYTVGKAENELKRIMKQKQDLTVVQYDFDRKKETTRAQDINMRNAIEDNISKLRLKKMSTRQELTRLSNGLLIPLNESAINSIVDCYQKLLELLKDKEPEFQNLKLETCVRAGKPLKIYPGMGEQKVQEIVKINIFEQDNQIKLSSMFNIIKSIFTKLKTLESELNFQYKQLILIKDDKMSDLDTIQEKQNSSYEGELKEAKKVFWGKRASRQDLEIQSKMEFMKIRSQFWVQFTQFWRTLLVKITNSHKYVQLYQQSKGVSEQIEIYFTKYGYHQNIQSQAQNHIVSQILFTHFGSSLSKTFITQALDTFVCDWKSPFYLKRQIIEEEINRLPSGLSPEQKLYMLLELLVNESNECFRVYLSHSIKIFMICYNALTTRKVMFSTKRQVKHNRNQMTQGKQDFVSIPSDNSVKSELLITRHIQTENEKPKEFGQRVLTELLKMAAVPIGQLLTNKGSKRGCFY